MSAELHNAALLPLLRFLVEHSLDEGDQWVVIESLCLAIGRLHGRNARETAVFVETIAERLTEGARPQ